MKKNGFTLIELITVISLIAMISLLVISSVSDNIEKAKTRAFTQLTENVENMTRIYISNNRESISDINVVNTEITLTLNDLVNDKLLQAPIRDPRTDEEISLNSEILIRVLGKNKYYVYWSYKDEGPQTDFVKPVITILGDDPVDVALGSTYSDAGATALDDVDGDITANIEVTNNVDTSTMGTYTVVYKVSDAAGNKADTKIRTVNVIDGNAPVITMLGSSPVNINVGDVYSDAGATALDDVDGDITADIVITSTVNPNVEGSYTVTYTVSDSAGNEATPVVRTVVVENLLLGTQSNPGVSCEDILNQGSSTGSGVYWIGNPAYQVYCDMTSDGGGWTLVMNNVGNQNDLDLNSSTVSSITDVSQHGNINFIGWMDGTKELRWTVGNTFTTNNLILQVQENGTAFSQRAFPTTVSTTCPSSTYKYHWVKIYGDAGWSNQHYTAIYGSCSGWTDYGTEVYNYYAHGDCASCYSPANVVFGDGYSGYYNWGNTYDSDGLIWNGAGFFNDSAPSFWTSTSTHQLWIR